jgi:Tfp pilus assembly protein PilF
LALLFALLATGAFLRWGETRERRWCLVAVVAFALALLSKTAVVMLPVVLLLIVWWRRGRMDRRTLIGTIPLFALSLVMGLVTIWFDRHHSIAGEVIRRDSVPARLAGAGWAVWFYVGKLLWPANLCVIYPRWRVDAGSVVAWIPVIALVVVCVAPRKHRGAFVGVACYVAWLFPVLGFFDVSFLAHSYVADHWQYVAMIPVVALACAAGAVAAQRWPGRWWPMIAAAMIAALGVATWRRTRIWRHDESLWRHTVAKNPSAWMAHNNLANALLARGRVDEAIAHYGETIRLKPEYGNAHYNLGIANFQKGDFKGAVAQFREAVRLKPKLAEAHNNLGAALAKAGQTNNAIAEFETAARLAPKWEEPRANLARLRR